MNHEAVRDGEIPAPATPEERRLACEILQPQTVARLIDHLPNPYAVELLRVWRQVHYPDVPIRELPDQDTDTTEPAAESPPAPC